MEDNKKKNNFTYELISLNKIIPNEENFYSINSESIKKLADSIHEVGLLHDIVVVKMNADSIKDKYKIISGERRYRALKLLSKQKLHSSNIMCKVYEDISEVESLIALIRGNSETRAITKKEKRIEQEKLEKLYKLKEKFIGKKLPIQKLVSEDLGTSIRHTRRISKINTNLIPELKSFYDDNKITVNSAVEFSSYDKESQYIIYEGLKTGITLTQTQIEDIKKENTVLLEQMKDKSSEIEKLNQELQEKNNITTTLKVDLEKATKELENLNNNIDKIKEVIKEEQRKENEEKVAKLNSDLNHLMNLHKELKKSKRSLEISLTEKELAVQSEKSELKEVIKSLQYQLEEKKEKIKFDHAEKEKEILKKFNVNKANEYKEDIISLIQKIADLDHLDKEDLNDITSDIKAFLKILA